MHHDDEDDEKHGVRVRLGLLDPFEIFAGGQQIVAFCRAGKGHVSPLTGVCLDGILAPLVEAGL